MFKPQNIYVEKSAYKYTTTDEILSTIGCNNVVEIEHYKDVFCRPKQNVILQKDNPSLILAVKHKKYLYPGANVCQDFGMKNFYYCSVMMNCVCNCQYCYLKGMYPSGHIILFVNLEDYFANIANNNKYICATYDCDLFPFENEIKYIKKWLDFAKANPTNAIEIRTKFKNLSVWNYKPVDNVIFAFSLSPENIIQAFEQKTSNLAARIENIKAAQDNGFVTRLCFDPIIYCKDWKSHYKNLIDKLSEEIDFNKIKDISVGSFRISQSYLKNMRKFDNISQIVNYPFENINGYYQYKPQLQQEMEDYLVGQLKKHIDGKKIFLWK